MRRLIASLLLLLTLGWAGIADASLLFFWRAEGTTMSGTDDFNGYSDTTFATTGAPAINATAALVGSNGVQIDGASERYTIDSDSTNLSVSAGTIAFWLRIQTFTNGAALYRFISNSGSTSNRLAAFLSTTTNNHIQFRTQSSAVGSSNFECSVALSNDTTYFIIYKWDSSVNDRRCEVYDSGGSHATGSPVEDLTTSFSGEVPSTSFPVTDGLAFGDWAGIGAAWYMDNMFLASTWNDAGTIYCNRSITSYTSYAACSSGAAPRGLLLGVN